MTAPRSTPMRRSQRRSLAAIIQAATGVAATQAQINGWVESGLTIDQVFVDFALGDQYSAYLQSNVQQYLTTLSVQAVSSGASEFWEHHYSKRWT